MLVKKHDYGIRSHFSLFLNDAVPGPPAAPAGPQPGAPGVGHAVHPGPLRLEAVLRGHLRDRRARRLHPGRQGQGGRDEEQGAVQVR